jgi:DNA-binding response OmpR family regulator
LRASLRFNGTAMPAKRWPRTPAKYRSRHPDAHEQIPCKRTADLAEKSTAATALLDYMLPDGSGVELGVQLRQTASRMQVIVMTGSMLPPEEEALCEEHDFPVLRKPFLASDVMNQIRSRLTPAAGAGGR